MTRLTELVNMISHTLHLVKPLVFELFMFSWAMIEIGKFAYALVAGHE